MTASKSLPAYPSLESLRKQAKKLARATAGGEARAIARARSHLPHAELPLSQRDAQLVLAREYGYSGWRELKAAVHERRGHGLAWAASEARRLIHDNDVAGLEALVQRYPALLSWTENEHEGGLLGMAASSFGDSFDADREENYTRPACAELLIDAGAVPGPSVLDGLIDSRARGLLRLFERKGLLPRTLEFAAALGDAAGVRARLDAGGEDLAAVNEALICACRFEQPEIASLLLARAIALDAELGGRIDGGPGRARFIEQIIAGHHALDFVKAAPAGPWQAFRIQQLLQAAHENTLGSFTRLLQDEPGLLDDACVDFQVRVVEQATLHGSAGPIEALLDLDPALWRRRPPPPSQAFEFAFTYAKTHMIPVLMRIWPLPHDLPHAAGMGDLDRVRRWFDRDGSPALGKLADHFPANSAPTRRNLQWGEPRVQHVLDTALAWAVVNNRFETAEFLLEHGADINTTWGSHEPASILHELVFHKNYEAMQFLVDRGIDMTITDHRWGGTARGWAYHAAKDERMAEWLAEAERCREGMQL